jgi:hypothetical protein
MQTSSIASATNGTHTMAHNSKSRITIAAKPSTSAKPRESGTGKGGKSRKPEKAGGGGGGGTGCGEAELIACIERKPRL